MRSPIDIRETELLGQLLRSHPDYGRRPLSINNCLRSRAVPHQTKMNYVLFYNNRYSMSVPLTLPKGD